MTVCGQNTEKLLTAHRPCIGVSSCLAGYKVRYDGDSKPHDFITGTLPTVCELVPVCPEAGIGMGVPRPAIHLRGTPGALAAVGVENPELDVTCALQEYALTTAQGLTAIAGYIFKSRSPSCGLGSVKMTQDSGAVLEGGDGLYAQGIVQALPLVPVTEETCLDDLECRDNFFERVFIYQRWLVFCQQQNAVKDLQALHRCHEFTLRARSDVAWESLNDIVQACEKNAVAEVWESYITRLMQVIKVPVTLCQHVKMQQQAAAHLDKFLPENSLIDLFAAIDNYTAGEVSRSVPVYEIRRLLAHCPHDRLQEQVYLYPSDQEMVLRF